jgi:hypothetical protein
VKRKTITRNGRVMKAPRPLTLYVDERHERYLYSRAARAMMFTTKEKTGMASMSSVLREILDEELKRNPVDDLEIAAALLGEGRGKKKEAAR